MLVRRRVATAALVGLLFSPARARAQAFTATPVATVAGGYSASETLPDNPQQDPRILLGPFLSFGPALGLLYETPRTTSSLHAAFNIALPLSFNFTFTGAPVAYSAQLAYASQIALTELTSLHLSLAGSALPVNSYVNGVDVSSASLDQSPTDSGYNFSLSGQESLTRQLSPESRVVQLANVTYNYPLNGTGAVTTDDASNTPSASTVRQTTLNVRNSLAVAHEWTRDTGTLTLTVGYTHFASVEDPSTDPRDQFVNSLIAGWQRPLTPSLTSHVDLGVLQAVSPQSTDGQLWQPTGGVSLAYDLDIATTSLSYTHGAAVNLSTATINLNDQVALRVALPIGATGFALGSSIGYTYSRPINIDGTFGDPLSIYLADIELGYVPLAVPNLSAGIRGTLNRQINLEHAELGSTRLALVATVGFSFPNAQAAAISRRIAPAYTPTPVLGSDSTPSPAVEASRAIERETLPEAPPDAPTTPAKP